MKYMGKIQDPKDLITKEYVDAKREVPSGGEEGQVLKKTSSGYGWDDESGGTESATQQITLTTMEWISFPTPYGRRYEQTQSVSGVTASTPVVIVDVALTGTDFDADAAALEAWQIVSANNVEQGEETLTFYAYDKPTVNFPVNVGVC